MTDDEYDEIILTAAIAVMDGIERKRNPLHNGHLRRVGLQAVHFLKEIRYLPDYVEDITDAFVKWLPFAAKLHDIGKGTIEVRILNLRDKFTAGELLTVQLHASHGAEIISSLGIRNKVILPIVAQHHEWWNGGGYPNHLKETDICLGARMVSILDSFDAMTNNRPYKRTFPVPEALTIMDKEVGTKFDPELYSIWRKTVDA